MGDLGEHDVGGLVDGRYLVSEELGRGGLAVVYRVQDAQTGIERALKQLLPRAKGSSSERSRMLFEREYHTLAQLSHPRTIAVYDYGFAEGWPYYTMDLLDGGDLYELAPVPWRRACALARDVCSALSLLHSRRLVYRDLSPRNVRCTDDGLAKLIDFGAIAPVGMARHMVGTVAFCAPEVIDHQPLDARTDLYALGATLYHTLTGRRPYPARTVNQVRLLWGTSPVPPSELVPDIPDALDALVMGLLELNPATRPASAAEVMERLSGIAELPIDEQLQVSQAYLITPTLVGRASQLARAGDAIARALKGRGGALTLHGDAGMGRSRLLDACVLRSKLAGALALRGDIEDAQQGDYGVVRGLARQLLERVPELALKAAGDAVPVLAHAVPQLLERTQAALHEFDDAAELRPAVQAALRQWIARIASEKPLLIALDDVPRADEPSAAFLALLARSCRRDPLLVVTTAESSSAESPALSLLRESSVEIQLTGLEPGQTKALLASVFGEVPNVDLLARRVHAVAGGNPRDIMRMAQHLVDRDVVRYEAGTWSLPDRIDEHDLPSSMAEALLASIETLSEQARTLAQSFALSPEQHFTFEEARVLAGGAAPGRLVRLLDELALADVVTLHAERFGLSQRRWTNVLCQGMTKAQERPLHRRLADVFRGRGELVRVTRHLLFAEEQEPAVDALVEHARATQEQTDASSDAFISLVKSLPADWMSCYAQALRACDELGRPPREGHHLRSRMAGLASVEGLANTDEFAKLLSRLERDSGLATYAELDPALEPGERLRISLEQAQARFEALDEDERVVDPFTALRQLARATIQISAITIATRDLAFYRTLPSLEPYLALSPALGVVHKLLAAVDHRCSGRVQEAQDLYLEILERTSQPDRGGLDESHHRHGTFGVRFGMGLIEASAGLGSSLKWASEVETNPLYEVNAWTIRLIYHLFQGETRHADRCRRKAEMLRVQNSRHQFFEGGHVAMELAANAAIGDLVRVKRGVADIERRTQTHPNWLPIHRYGRGEYHRLRGDYASALEELDAAVGNSSDATHEAWVDACSALVKVLSRLGRHEEAAARGRDLLAVAVPDAFGCSSHQLASAVAEALSKAGSHDEAQRYAKLAVDGLTSLGSTGLRPATARAIQAEVSAAAGDSEAAKAASQTALQAFGPDANARLVARFKRFLDKRTKLRPDEVITTGQEGSALTITQSTLRTTLQRSLQEGSYAQCALELLVKNTGCAGGLLYQIRSGAAPEIVARHGVQEAPADVEALVPRLAAADPASTVTEATVSELGSPGLEPVSAVPGSDGESFRLMLVTQSSQRTLVAALLVAPDGSFTFPGEVVYELNRALAEPHGLVP